MQTDQQGERPARGPRRGPGHGTRHGLRRGRGRRRPRAVWSLITGLAVLAVLAVSDPGGTRPDTGTLPAPPTSSQVGPSGGVVPSDAAPPADPQPSDLPTGTVAAFARGGVTDDDLAAVAADPAIAAATLVRGRTLHLLGTRDATGLAVDTLPDGWSYPIEVLSADPASYDHLVGAPLLSDLEPGEALLGASSADVRGLGPGAWLSFADAPDIRVAAVVPDALIGAAEVMIRDEDAADAATAKYLLALPAEANGGTAMEELLAGHLDDRPLRVVHGGDGVVLRHTTGVLPPAQLKRHFGEFAIHDRPGRDVQAGFSWVSEHVVEETVPILGRVECHRALFEPLRDAMQELIDRGASHTIDMGDYGGCWVPRTQGSDGPLSSHAWGVAIDFNVSRNHYGAPPDQADVLVEVMTAHGFAWGGEWLTPDAMHFELVPTN